MTTNRKIKIVYESLASLNSDWIIDLINQYFELVPYDPAATYDKSSTVFYQNVIGSKTKTAAYNQFVDQGYKVLFDNLWELKIEVDPGAYSMHNVNWFWYNESLWYRHLGYNSYVPNRTYEKTAFMPMRLEKPHRSALKKYLQPCLDDFVWSYVVEGTQLPNGGDAVNDWNTQRLFRPEWYDKTCFSIVAETSVSPVTQPIFVTEKTFKPMAFQHPFMILSNRGTLAYLRSQGFETFENLFDESYDAEINYIDSIKTIVKNVENFEKQPHSQLTLDKIQHNYNHFFDKALVTQRIVKEIIEPILEYAEA